MDTSSHHDRGRVLRDLDALAGSGRTDWRTHPGIAAWFEDEADLLGAIQTRWFHVLGGCLEAAVETGGGELVDDVREAYGRAIAAHPGLRRILDEYAGHPVLAGSQRKERQLIAAAAGVADSHEVTDRFVPFVPQQRKPWYQRIFAAA